MFVVTVLQNTGCGDISIPILVTKHLASAILVTRTIERFGYEFYNDDMPVVVTEIIFGIIYRKGSDNTVFIRRFFDGGWTEEWRNPKLQKGF